jgi:hypothetical protein
VLARREALAEGLEDADEDEELPLAGRGDVRPLLRGGQTILEAGVRRPGDAHAVRLEAVADEGGHGDAAVLDLGVAQVADRRAGRQAPALLEAEEV